MTPQFRQFEEDQRTYRLYEIGGDGHIQTFTLVAARTDEEAVEQARNLADGRVVELWERARILLRLPPEAEQGTGRTGQTRLTSARN